jgi:hypothetical protein
MQLHPNKSGSNPGEDFTNLSSQSKYTMELWFVSSSAVKFKSTAAVYDRCTARFSIISDTTLAYISLSQNQEPLKLALLSAAKKSSAKTV